MFSKVLQMNSEQHARAMTCHPMSHAQQAAHVQGAYGLSEGRVQG